MENIIKNSFETKPGINSIIKARKYAERSTFALGDIFSFFNKVADKKTKKLMRKSYFVPNQTESKTTVADVSNFKMKPGPSS